MSGRARFYRDVAVACLSEGGGYLVLLDAKQVRTPAGAILVLPTRALGDAVAEEWLAQGEKIQPATMRLTKLANTAIDRIAPDTREAEAQILAFATSDLVCYRAHTPVELVARQREAWDPLIDWVSQAYDAKFKTGEGIAFVEQPQDAVLAIGRALASRHAFELAGMLATAMLTGSAVLSLALADGRLEAEAAFAASQLDAIFQLERWGRDSEAEAALAGKQSELVATARFLDLLRA
jgi:chaperone required for assembly of F1-ATPase